ncbi:cobaltochelatase subunit CobN [Desulfosporosinus burensis]
MLFMMCLSLLSPIVNAEDHSVGKIELDNSSVKITVGSSKTVQATVYNQLGEIMTGQTVTWSSDKTEITTVDQNGLVEAIGEGTATVTASCDGVEAVCEVTVEEAKVTKIELDNSSVKIVVGANKTVLATVYNQLDEIMTGQTVTWSSNKPEVATVDENGLVTAVSVGITTITVVCSEISIQCQVEVFNGYPTNVVIITGSKPLVSPLVEAYHNLTEKRNPPYQFGLRIFSADDLASNTAKVQQAVQNADVVLVQMISDTRTEDFHTILSDSWEAEWKNGKAPAIFTQGCTEGFAINIVKDLPIQANINKDDLTALTNYISARGTDNCERLLLFLASKYGEGDVTTAEDLTPIGSRGTFAYHPDAQGNGTFLNPEDYYNWYTSRSGYDPSAPWVGIMDYDSAYIDGDYDLTTELLKSLEKKGNNVVLIFTPSSKKNDSVRSYFYRDLNGDGKKEPAIDTFICPMGFAFDSKNQQNTIDLFKEMNVPVLAPIYASDLEKWESDPAGTSSSIYWNVAMPELDGRIEPVLMGGYKTLNVDEATGAIINKKVAIPDRIERVAGRATNWAKLHKMENQDKKVAIIYYNHDGGKDGIGASYLNVPRSLTEILKAFKNNDYTVNQDGSLSSEGEITEEKVFNEMFNKGRNIGGWAPGELEKFAAQEGIIKISLDKYLSWYYQLPVGLREAVEKDWGAAPGKVMVQDEQIIIPGVINGNVFFGPQPMRGWGEDVTKITHSPTLPPSHQYLAFYWWLQHEFKADAAIHLGTHGTAEWLPGKSVGLSGEDWPDIVQGDMPNIYPYIVNNPGEGTQAKRRGYAVLIDHLTSALVNTELYGNLRELHDLANEYDTAVVNNLPAEDIEKIKVKVKILVVNEGVGEKVGVSADDLDKNFDSSLEKCKQYLDDLEADVTPLGLHTFGVPPQGDAFEGMVKAIVNYDPATRSALEAEIRANLQNTTQEMDMLLLALNAGYIPPNAGNDPVRDPSVMPTGKNLVSFDPRKVPDKTAWVIGKKCADDLLAAYYAKHGSYPESVGVVLWAVETMRTKGQSVAMIMRLLGTEPVWDATGKVTGYKITSSQDLGRPRIDVVVTASSLFRDTFSNVMTLLDKAIRELAINTDNGQDNYIKKHYETLKSEYLSQGKSTDDAEFLAASRVYSEAPGSYGNGLAAKIGATESWNTSEDLVDTYLTRSAYIYGTDKDGTPVYGQAAKDTFESVLKNVQATVQVRDSTYGALDNDDVAQYLGGLTLAAKWASGKDVDAYIANTRLGVDNLKIQTLREFVSQELDSRLLNPKFVEAMLKEGYAGSATLAKWIGNVFLIAATTGAISDNAWHDLAATYIFNDAVRAKLDPYALQAMIGYQLEAARKGMWQASKEDLTQLSNVYMQTMVDYGVVCCHHTCKNILMNEWLAQFSTLDDRVRELFQKTLADATQQNVNIAMQTKSVPTTTSNSSSSDKVEEKIQLLDKVVDDQPEPINIEQPQQTATQGQTVSMENTQDEATAQTPTAVAAAGNLPAASEEQVKPTAKDAQEQNTAGEQKGNTQEYKAYEISEEGKQNKASGVSMLAILGVGGAMAAVAFGMMKGKMLSR